MGNDRCVNPFVHRLCFKTSDYFKIFTASILLVPIRVVFTLLLFLLASMVAKLTNYLINGWKFDKQSEFKLKKSMRLPTVWISRAMFFCAGFYRIKIVNKTGRTDTEPEAPIIVMAPHTSPFDVLALIGLDIPAPVARHDSIDIPLFGNVIKLSDPVFVERDSKTSRNNVLTSVMDKVKYVRVAFWPEGTCANGRAMCQFKSGAFKPGLPVQPIALKFDHANGLDALSWTWDGPPYWLLMWLTLCRWDNSLEMIKLPVYYPTDDEKSDPDLYAHNVSVLLGRELGLATLDYSYDDVKYLKQSVFRSPVCFKFLKLVDKISNELVMKNGLKVNYNIKNKKQIFLQSISDIVSDKLEKIELNSPTNITSVNDIISLMDIQDYPVICNSLTVNDLYRCLKNATINPNTKHFAAVLHLCDIRVQCFWQRLENSFNVLSESRADMQTNVTINNNSLHTILWLAFGIQKTLCDKHSIATEITFDVFKDYLLNNFSDCIEENARQLLTQNHRKSGR